LHLLDALVHLVQGLSRVGSVLEAGLSALHVVVTGGIVEVSVDKALAGSLLRMGNRLIVISVKVVSVSLAPRERVSVLIIVLLPVEILAALVHRFSLTPALVDLTPRGLSRLNLIRNPIRLHSIGVDINNFDSRLHHKGFSSKVLVIGFVAGRRHKHFESEVKDVAVIAPAVL